MFIDVCILYIASQRLSNFCSGIMIAPLQGGEGGANEVFVCCSSPIGDQKFCSMASLLEQRVNIGQQSKLPFLNTQ